MLSTLLIGRSWPFYPTIPPEVLPRIEPGQKLFLEYITRTGS